MFFSEAGTVAAVGPSDIVVTDLVVVSNAPADSPDTFTTAGAYSVTIAIQDLASGESDALNISGKLSGTISQSASNLTNVFFSDNENSVVLGGYRYSVTPSFTAPGPGVAGAISVHVAIEVAPPHELAFIIDGEEAARVDCGPVGLRFDDLLIEARQGQFLIELDAFVLRRDRGQTATPL